MIENELDLAAADEEAVRDELEALKAVWPELLRIVELDGDRGTRVEIDIPGPDGDDDGDGDGDRPKSSATLTLSATIPKRGYPSRLPPSDVRVSARHLSAEDAAAVAAALVSSPSPSSSSLSSSSSCSFVPGAVVLFDWIEELRGREELFVRDKEEKEEEEEKGREDDDGDDDDDGGDNDDSGGGVEEREECAVSLPRSPSNNASTTTTTTTSTSTSSSYLTVASEHTATYEVKKSTFRATCFPISTAEEAERGVAERSDPSAAHNCFAFVTPDGGDARCSDDGEPGGTAGRPILTAIFAEGGGDGADDSCSSPSNPPPPPLPLRGVAVLVSRWRNGPLLGASGLARAYGHAARVVLRGSGRAVVLARASVRVEGVPLACLGGVFGALSRAGAADTREEEEEEEEEENENNDKGSDVDGDGGGDNNRDDGEGRDQTVTLSASLPAKNVQALVSAVASATSGRARVVVGVK